MSLLSYDWLPRPHSQISIVLGVAFVLFCSVLLRCLLCLCNCCNNCGAPRTGEAERVFENGNDEGEVQGWREWGAREGAGSKQISKTYYVVRVFAFIFCVCIRVRSRFLCFVFVFIFVVFVYSYLYLYLYNPC